MQEKVKNNLPPNDDIAKNSSEITKWHDIPFYELYKILLCAMFEKNTIITVIIFTILSIVHVKSYNPPICLRGVDHVGQLISIAGFALASMSVIFAISEIKSMDSEKKKNIFAEFTFGIILPLLGIVFGTYGYTEIHEFFYAFSILWMVNSGLHIFSLSSAFGEQQG